LRDDGVVWVVLGDSYARSGGWADNSGLDGKARGESGRAVSNVQAGVNGQRCPAGLKEKDLVGIPWRFAFAMQDAGWWLRQDVIWSKANAMPESVRDRCTRSHEYVFMFTKSARYFYDADAVSEPRGWAFRTYRNGAGDKTAQLKEQGNRSTAGLHDGREHYGKPGKRNLRSVWAINTEPYPGSHFATFPRDIARRCIRAGSREGDVVLDPFCGSGTTVEVAFAERRFGVGVDKKWEYCRDHAVDRFRAGYAQGRQIPLPYS
jgi:DNA modification methylase